MKQKSKRVIPGFGISMGVTLTILSIVVLIPLASLVVYTAQLSPSEIRNPDPSESAGKLSCQSADCIHCLCNQCSDGRDFSVGAGAIQIPIETHFGWYD